MVWLTHFLLSYTVYPVIYLLYCTPLPRQNSNWPHIRKTKGQVANLTCKRYLFNDDERGLAHLVAVPNVSVTVPSGIAPILDRP